MFWNQKFYRCCAIINVKYEFTVQTPIAALTQPNLQLDTNHSKSAVGTFYMSPISLAIMNFPKCSKSPAVTCHRLCVTQHLKTMLHHLVPSLLWSTSSTGSLHSLRSTLYTTLLIHAHHQTNHLSCTTTSNTSYVQFFSHDTLGRTCTYPTKHTGFISFKPTHGCCTLRPCFPAVHKQTQRERPFVINKGGDS